VYPVARPARAEDIPECFEIAAGRYGYGQADRPWVTDFWRDILDSRMHISGVVEDLDRPPHSRIASFGIAAFVRADFLAEVRSGRNFHVDGICRDWWDQGRRVRLEPPEFEREHAGEGLGVAMLHQAHEEQRYRDNDFWLLVEASSGFFQVGLAHIRAREFLQQTYGEADRERLARLGLRDCRLYPRDGSARRNSGTRNHPYLMEAVFADLLKRPELRLTAAGSLARLREPRFGFRTGDHEVLRLAMEGRPDPDIAEELRLSVAAIKKRWQGIFLKVQSVDAVFFEEDAVPDFEGDARNRRQHLLRVLRQHPEEFWAPRRKPTE
jgi:DNA-binding CsgD family transcriptional regulator